MVVIAFGMWRWGRSGGASGLITGGNGKLREQPVGTRSSRGNRLPLEDQESVSCDAQRGVMKQATPAAPFKVPESHLHKQLDGPQFLCAGDIVEPAYCLEGMKDEA